MSQNDRFKPGATFAFKPGSNLGSGKKPDFSKTSSSSTDKTVLQEIGAMVNERAGGAPPGDVKPQRAASPDDDFDITAVMRSRGMGSIKASAIGGGGNDPFANATSRPTFGHPTQMMSSRKQKAGIFIHQKNRPEHHLSNGRGGGGRGGASSSRGGTKMSGPLAPTFRDRKPPPLPVFDSNMLPRARTNYGGETFYTDPTKADADLKALLEGGMDDDDDEDDHDEQEEQKEIPEKTTRKEEPEPEKVATPPATQTNDAPTNAIPKETPKKANDIINSIDSPAIGSQEPTSAAASPVPTPRTKRLRKAVGKDGVVDGLQVRLLPHQVEGVEWMRGRELGPVKKGKVPKGGLLADDMGLGKTLQSVSLILTNRKPARDAPGWKKEFEKVEKTTLVVAPLALIRQWEHEIKDKVEKSHSLKVLVHHGPQRTKSFKEMTRYDVVVTTFQILVSEYGSSSDGDDGAKVGCFGLHWWRVILDEAHTIKNRNAKATKACYALRSEYRWCLSGTPMQNNLDELQSLVKFLRISPYDDLRQWKEHIDKPMKNGSGHVAIERLQSLLRCFMKRRTKAILKKDGALVPGGKPTVMGEQSSTGFRHTERNVVMVSAKLQPNERQFYDRLEARADQRMESMMRDKMSYANAFTLLLRLRQACNHPKLVAGKLDKDKDALSTDSSQKTASQDADVDAMADMFSGMGIAAKACSVCGKDLTTEEAALRDNCAECHEDMEYFQAHQESIVQKPKKQRRSRNKKSKKNAVKETTEPKPNVRRPRNRNAIIDSDDEDDDQGSAATGADDSMASISDLTKAMATQTLDEDKQSDDASASDASSDSEDASETESSDGDDEWGTGTQVLASAKIRELSRILRQEGREHKFIVFSQFTSMLDLVEPFLRKDSFRYVRYDGSMKNDAREESLRSLREDPSTRILLCSLKCGSLGLNLTAATRVIIVEPFWNPFVEEQAIDRVHRLTQTVDVTVYKLTVEGTVEERILDLQAKKRELAEKAIESGAKKEAGKLNINDMMNLFKPRHGDASGNNRPKLPAGPLGDKRKPREEDAIFGRRW